MPLLESLTSPGGPLQRAMGSRFLVELGLGFGVLSLVGILVLPYLIAKMPVDYFVRENTRRHGGICAILLCCARNLLGAALLLIGIVMLVLPGQGVLTILVGIVCLDFPSKRRLERWFLGRPRVMHSVNALRCRLGQPPLEFHARAPVETVEDD